ncbi:hypothetical protein [Spirosoma sp. KNUC1025]|uniref:hypothetical protein n=1 Tax=Spirosoma sp. KNUC1025 TaxID=2894082 RepID=UPI0038641136|nr:hypothetical protein LN737_00575 [Spirosoma sp. KNUC1025]
MLNVFITSVLILVISISCVSSTNNKASATFINSDSLFKGKVFDATIKGSPVNALDELTIQAVFNQDTTGSFRIGSKASATYQIDFVWHFVGDSLSIREVDLAPTIAATHQTRYGLTQEPYGYLLTGEHQQIILRWNKAKFN